MPEPISTTAGGFALGKIFYSIGGLFGGYSLSFFWQPTKLHDHGKMAAGAIIGGISTASAFALGGLLTKQFGLDDQSSDVALGIGWLVGISSIGVIGLLANFFDKREGKDILEVANEIRGAKKPIIKRSPAKRGVKK